VAAGIEEIKRVRPSRTAVLRFALPVILRDNQHPVHG
jgi:hypothetical protein